MRWSDRARLWTFVTLLTGPLGCSDDEGGETPRTPADGSVSDAGLLDARLPDARLPDGNVSIDARADDAEVVIQPNPDAAPGTPPSAAFTLSDTQGAGTLWVKATSDATPGAAVIVETLYDFGEGAGFTAAATHRYAQPGTFEVRQQVRDQAGLLAASGTQTVTLSAFTPVRFSSTDHRENMRPSADGLSVENRSFKDASGPGVIRTDSAIAPGSGVFYFEGKLLAPVRVGGFGVATADAPLDQGSGGNAASLGYEAYGPLRSTGSTCTGAAGIDASQSLVGFVIDYRGSSPVVHLVQGAQAPAVIASCTMSVTAPLYATYWSERATVGYEGRINAGQDTVNQPFVFSLDALKAALMASGHVDAAAALVPGFGRTRAGRVNQVPTLDAPATVTVAFGQPVTLSGSALDPEDGDLSAQISWVDTASLWHARVAGMGAGFTFTPNSIGIHPVDATVIDLDGGKVSKTVKVVVTGTLPQPNPVQLAVDATTGQGVTVSADGLSATFAGTGKDGVKANTGLYGDFWYFEVHRINPVRNMGFGLMVAEGSLNPYAFDDVPWSVSVNTVGGVWRELMPFDEYTGMAGDTDFGWAVDYRGEHPKVYVIARGALLTTFDLEEVWTPLYPILYGNIAYPPIPGPDLGVNFGATPLAIDAKTILAAAGIDVSAMKLGWGAHAH
jgi:hypothetical protein